MVGIHYTKHIPTILEPRLVMEFPTVELSDAYVNALLGGDEPLPCEDCGIRDDSVKYSEAYQAWLCDGDFINRNMAP